MTERAYTVQEIDALRQAVDNKYLFGRYRGPAESEDCTNSRPFMEKDRVLTVEQRVRTHMLAGHTAADLLESERPFRRQA